MNDTPATSRPTIRRLAAPLARALGIAAVVLACSAAHALTGSGVAKSETRAVSGFQAIAVSAPVKLVIRQGAKEALELRADDNLLSLFETEVVDHQGTPTLEIRARRGSSYSAKTEPVVTVDLIRLEAIAISGSGDVTSAALKSPALKLSVSGSGDIKLDRLDVDDLSLRVTGAGDARFVGRAAKLGVSIAGSGDVDAIGLSSDDVSVRISGSGSASVNAAKTLAVSIAGSGDVTYTGAANPKTAIAGSGTVTRK